MRCLEGCLELNCVFFNTNDIVKNKEAFDDIIDQDIIKKDVDYSPKEHVKKNEVEGDIFIKRCISKIF